MVGLGFVFVFVSVLLLLTLHPDYISLLLLFPFLHAKNCLNLVSVMSSIVADKESTVSIDGSDRLARVLFCHSHH